MNKYIEPMLKIINNHNHLTNIILINEEKNDVEQSTLLFKNLDIIHLKANPSNDTILNKSNIKNCSVFMIIPDTWFITKSKADENKTVLTALTKSISEEIRVTAHILNQDYESHLQRANVNEIVHIDSHIPIF